MSRRRSLVWLWAAFGWAACGPAFAQTLGHGSNLDVSYGRVVAALLLCIALAAGAALALRHRLGAGAKKPLGTDRLTWASGGRRVPRHIELLDRLRVSPQLEVCLLRCEGRRYLIASSSAGTVLLDKDWPAGPGVETGP